MRRTAMRTEPISIHLERHRDCLERRRAERGSAPPVGGDRNDGPELSTIDRRRPPIAVLPFERQHDDD